MSVIGRQTSVMDPVSTPTIFNDISGGASKVATLSSHSVTV